MHNSTSGSTAERSRHYNDRVIIQCIRHLGEVSRAELARLTQLSAQTVSVIVSRLLKSGLIKEAGRRYGGRGQPSVKLILNPHGAFAIGVNVDRDHIGTAIVDFCGNILAARSHDLPWPSLANALGAIFSDIRNFLQNHAINIDRVQGVGVALPSNLGVWQEELGFVPQPDRDWGAGKLRESLSVRTGLPVWIENDGTAAALGERFFGVGQQFANFVYVYLGQALGGGIIVEGECLRGDHGNAGDFGAFPIIGCAGRPHGVLMSQVSLSALYRHLRENGYPCEQPRDVEAVYLSDPRPLNLWLDSAAEALCVPLLSLIAILDPGAVILGGRMGPVIHERLIDSLATSVRGYLPKGQRLPEFLGSTLGSDAGVVGAAILPFYETFAPYREVLLLNRDQSAANLAP